MWPPDDQGPLRERLARARAESLAAAQEQLDAAVLAAESAREAAMVRLATGDDAARVRAHSEHDRAVRTADATLAATLASLRQLRDRQEQAILATRDQADQLAHETYDAAKQRAEALYRSQVAPLDAALTGSASRPAAAQLDPHSGSGAAGDMAYWARRP